MIDEVLTMDGVSSSSSFTPGDILVAIDPSGPVSQLTVVNFERRLPGGEFRFLQAMQANERACDDRVLVVADSTVEYRFRVANLPPGASIRVYANGG